MDKETAAAKTKELGHVPDLKTMAWYCSDCQETHRRQPVHYPPGGERFVVCPNTEKRIFF